MTDTIKNNLLYESASSAPSVTIRRNMSAPILAIIGVRAMNVIRIVGVSVSLAVLVEPALAGQVGVPGPIAGVGLPALALIGGAYWIGRKFFGRKR